MEVRHKRGARRKVLASTLWTTVPDNHSARRIGAQYLHDSLRLWTWGHLDAIAGQGCENLQDQVRFARSLERFPHDAFLRVCSTNESSKMLQISPVDYSLWTSPHQDMAMPRDLEACLLILHPRNSSCRKRPRLTTIPILRRYLHSHACSRIIGPLTFRVRQSSLTASSQCFHPSDNHIHFPDHASTTTPWSFPASHSQSPIPRAP